MRDYKKIKAWQLADQLALSVYKLSRNFPDDERFGLISQLRRASVSVACNIVEGASRKHKKDYLNFLYISRGSLAESEYLLGLSKRLHYCSEDEYNVVAPLCSEVHATLFGLIRSVEAEL